MSGSPLGGDHYAQDMRKQLGKYLLTGGGALLLGLVPSLVGNVISLGTWVLLGLVVVAFAAGLILRPWTETDAERKLREYDQAKITVASQQDLTQVELELARLRHAQLTPTFRQMTEYARRNNVESMAASAASSIVATGHKLMAEQDLKRELENIEILGLERRRKALQRIVEG